MVLSRIKRTLIRAGVFAFMMALWEFYIKKLVNNLDFYGYVLAYFIMFLLAYIISWWVIRNSG